MFGIEWTQGAMMFYGGIAGMGIIIFVGIIAIVTLSRSKARLTKKLDDEYGKRNP